MFFITLGAPSSKSPPAERDPSNPGVVPHHEWSSILMMDEIPLRWPMVHPSSKLSVNQHKWFCNLQKNVVLGGQKGGQKGGQNV